MYSTFTYNTSVMILKHESLTCLITGFPKGFWHACYAQLLVSKLLKLLQNLTKHNYPIVQGSLPKITKKEFSIFIIFSDTYTCSYVM